MGNPTGIIDRFATLSGLHVNASKTILVPLWHIQAHEIRGRRWFTEAGWAHVQVEGKAKYLAVYLGPGATQHDSYAEPTSKLRKRVALWATPKPPLQLSSIDHLCHLIAFVR